LEDLSNVRNLFVVVRRHEKARGSVKKVKAKSVFTGKIGVANEKVWEVFLTN